MNEETQKKQEEEEKRKKEEDARILAAAAAILAAQKEKEEEKKAEFVPLSFDDMDDEQEPMFNDKTMIIPGSQVSKKHLKEAKKEKERS